MAKFNLILPRMGESVSEATIVKWLKQPGDFVEVDESVVDIATDKVDSDVPSPVGGRLIEQLFSEDTVAQVGDVIAVLEVEGGDDDALDKSENLSSDSKASDSEDNADFIDSQESEESHIDSNVASQTADEVGETTLLDSVVSNRDPHEGNSEEAAIPGLDMLTERGKGGRFYSPLVKNIANEEGIGADELDRIPGSGLEGRVTKQDILNYIDRRGESSVSPDASSSHQSKTGSAETATVVESERKPAAAPVLSGEGDEIIEMDRMRKLIAQHMVDSVQTSPHVCSFVEADVTNLVNWRNRIKDDFERREGVKITFTPIFIEAV